MNDDLISRKAVLKQIRKIECEPGYQHVGEDWAVGLCMAESIVECTESVDPQDVMELPSIKLLSAEEVAKSMSYGTVYTYLNWFEVIKQIYDLGFAIIEKRKIDNG